jgi:hypothetical protein
MMNWSEYEEAPQRKTILPYWVAVILGIGVAGALWAGRVYAEPRFQVQDKDVSVTLYPR